jgi:hypothetical protein
MPNELLLAEGHWTTNANYSVKALFDMLSDILHKTTHAYKYVNFADEPSFTAQLQAMANGGHKYLYIGAHGGPDGIEGTRCSSRITKTILQNRLTNFNGLYLGVCEFGSHETLTELVNRVPGLVWCSGYRKSVNYADSCILDLAFWNEFQKADNSSPPFSTPQHLILQVAKEVQRKYSSLILELGFNIAVRLENLDTQSSNSASLMY